MKSSQSIIRLFQLVLSFCITTEASAVVRSTVSSGDWNNPACWSPKGVPSATDDVLIRSNHDITLNSDQQVNDLTIAAAGTLNGSPGRTLTLSGDINVNGIVNMNTCDFQLNGQTQHFTLGQASRFTWEPGNNTVSGAGLFLSSRENFHASSTLVIKKWYDYSVPLAESISGNFGNVTINSFGDNLTIFEWNQKNEFESHSIRGTLTIEDGWVTLDKAGSISSTTIGNIVLASDNSTFIAHHGNHPGSFSLQTGSVKNFRGNFYGLFDGDGNIRLNVNGNFENTGNVKIIYNSGIQNIANGDADVRIKGDYVQSAGDTRIIYNLASLQSGVLKASFRSLQLDGGIFMGQSACNTSFGNQVINIEEDLVINFSNPTDKFRGTGLTSIGSTLNNARFEMNVGGNVQIQGNDQSEFTSSASAGTERINIKGNLQIAGCQNSFNYGLESASHTSLLLVGGIVNIQGGKTYLSRNAGNFYSSIKKGITIENGELIIKGNSGTSTVNINGPYDQVGGKFLLHSNPNTASLGEVTLKMFADFQQTGGIIDFDDNTGGSSHMIVFKGKQVTFGGSGIIRQSSGQPGRLIYEADGIINHFRKDNHQVENIIQEVRSGCELVARGASIQLCGMGATRNSMSVLPGAKLNLRQARAIQGNPMDDAILSLDWNATLYCSNPNGLRRQASSTLPSGITLQMHNKSIVEITGSGYLAGSDNNTLDEKYGILRINLSKNDDQVRLANDVSVRTRLELLNGSISLNNKQLTIENGNADAIKRTNGYVLGDLNQQAEAGSLRWMDISKEVHEFPFGMKGQYLPVRIYPQSGAGNEVSICTQQTNSSNEPYPSSVGSFPDGQNYTSREAVDRWWSIQAPGLVADLELTFASTENTLSPDLKSKDLCALQWKENSWLRIPGDRKQSGKTTRVRMERISDFSKFLVVSDESSKLFDLKIFEATRQPEEVSIRWATINENTPALFSIEKSTDGVHFHEIGFIQNNATGIEYSDYTFSDKELNSGTSYYRLKLIFGNNIYAYSEVRIVGSENRTSPMVTINRIGPNPCANYLDVNYSSSYSAAIEIMDASGKILSRVQAPANTSGEMKRIETDKLPTGVYFLCISSNGKKDIRKIVKNE